MDKHRNNKSKSFAVKVPKPRGLRSYYRILFRFVNTTYEKPRRSESF